MTGGSHAEARAIVPPRFAGLVLAAIQSGYSEAACPTASRGRAPAPKAAAPTPPHPMRFRKLRRSIPWWRPSNLPRSGKDIVALLLGRTRERSTRRRRKEWSDGATRLKASQEWAVASTGRCSHSRHVVHEDGFPPGKKAVSTFGTTGVSGPRAS